MKKLITLAAFALLAHACAFAAPPRAESIEALLALTKAEQMLDTVYGGLESSIRQGMSAAAGNRSLTPEQQKLVEALPARMAQVMREEMNWGTLKPLMVKVYAESFDQEEVDGLIEFYRSPIGRRFVEKMPVVTQRSMQATQQLMDSVMPRLQQAMQAAMREAGLR